MSIFAPAKRINYISTNLKIMYLDAAKKQEIFEKYGKSNTDRLSVLFKDFLFFSCI